MPFSDRGVVYCGANVTWNTLSKVFADDPGLARVPASQHGTMLICAKVVVQKNTHIIGLDRQEILKANASHSYFDWTMHETHVYTQTGNLLYVS